MKRFPANSSTFASSSAVNATVLLMCRVSREGRRLTCPDGAHRRPPLGGPDRTRSSSHRRAPRPDGSPSAARSPSSIHCAHRSSRSRTAPAAATRVRTHEAVAWIRKETPVTPMAHLTCVSAHTRATSARSSTRYDAAGVENILALGGDPPSDPANARPSDYRYALELVEHVREHAAGFSIGVAAHPELAPAIGERHRRPRSPRRQAARSRTSRSRSSSSSPTTTCASSTSLAAAASTSR